MKKNVKNRNPNDYNQLKKFCIEEWNQINPKNYYKNFIKRVKKVISINGNRLEPHHLEEIRREEENEEEEKNYIKIGERKLKRVFNEVFLDNLKKSEIRSLKKKKKGISRFIQKKNRRKRKKRNIVFL